MTQLGTILPTRASLLADDRYHDGRLLTRRAFIVKNKINQLPHVNNARDPSATRYMLPDGKWLEVGLDSRVRKFEHRIDGDYMVGFVTKF